MPIKKTSRYKDRDSLRPNPTVKPLANDPALRNAQDEIDVGDFGSWSASAKIVTGLPKGR